MNIPEWLSSKKTKTFIVGLVTLIGVNFLGLPEDVAARLGEGVIALVLGGQATFAVQDVYKEKTAAAKAAA